MTNQAPDKKDGAPEARRQSSPQTTSIKFANGADKASGVANAKPHDVARAKGVAHNAAGKSQEFGEGRNSVLGRYWRKYAQLGYSPIGTHPVGTVIKDKERDKSPVMYRWQEFCDRQSEPREITLTLQLQSRSQIGVAGGFEKFVPLDVDTEDPALQKAILKFMSALFPDAPLRKGKRTRIGAYLFQWADEGNPPWLRYVDGANNTVFELLGNGRQIVMPPSMHQSGVPYEMADGEELPPHVHELPKIGMRHIEALVAAIEEGGFQIDEIYTRELKEDLPTPEELRVYEKLVPAKKAVEHTTDFLKYTAKISIQGKRGHDNACRVWQRCADIGCPVDKIAPLMWAHWNSRCRPPWSTYDALAAEVQGLLGSRRTPIGVNNPERLAAMYGEEVDATPAKDAATGGAQPAGEEGGASMFPNNASGSQDGDKKTKVRPSPVFDPWERYVVPDFPFEVLPPDVARFVETHSLIIGCDPSALAMCALSALSSALDHRFALKMMRNGDFCAGPRLWMLLFGPPSVKKTPMQNAALAPLKAHENRIRDGYDAAVLAHKTAEGEARDEPPLPRRFISNDMTPEMLGEMLARHDRGMLVARDELAGWIGSMEKYATGRGGASDRGFWLQSYDGGSYTVDRIKRGEMRIRNLSISLLGGIQPNRLAELHGLTSDGLLQRFIPVITREAKFPEDVSDDGSKIAYTRLIDQCLAAEPTTLRMNDAAMEAMTRLRRHIHDVEISSGGFADGFQGFVGKLAGVAGSLALILHLIKGGDPRVQALKAIDAETIEQVDHLVRDFILPHAFEFYRASETATNGDRLQRIASWILTNGKARIVASDLTSGVRMMRGLSLAQVNEWLSPLIA